MLLVKSNLLASAGKPEEAFQQVKRAAEAAPDLAAAQFTLGKLLCAGRHGGRQARIQRGSPNQSARWCRTRRTGQTVSPRRAARPMLRSRQRGGRAAPRSTEANVALAGSLLANGDLGAAAKSIETLLNEQPKLSQGHVLRGRLAIGRKDLAAAREAFETALELDPIRLRRSRDCQCWICRLATLRQLRPGLMLRSRGARVELLALGAQVYIGAEELGTAEELLRKAIAADPSLLLPIPCWDVYVKQQKLDQAVAEFDAMAARQSTRSALSR